MMEFKALCVEEEIYGSIGDQIKRRPSKLEQTSEIEFTFKSNKLNHILDTHDLEQGEPLRIVSANGKESYTLDNDREKAIEAIKLLALCHE
jgi:hypothetical protein